jgi:hypothetical protein
MGKQEIHEHETPSGSFSRLIFLMAANQICEKCLTVPLSAGVKRPSKPEPRAACRPGVPAGQKSINRPYAMFGLFYIFNYFELFLKVHIFPNFKKNIYCMIFYTFLSFVEPFSPNGA